MQDARTPGQLPRAQRVARGEAYRHPGFHWHVAGRSVHHAVRSSRAACGASLFARGDGRGPLSHRCRPSPNAMRQALAFAISSPGRSSPSTASETLPMWIASGTICTGSGFLRAPTSRPIYRQWRCSCGSDACCRSRHGVKREKLFNLEPPRICDRFSETRVRRNWSQQPIWDEISRHSGRAVVRARVGHNGSDSGVQRLLPRVRVAALRRPRHQPQLLPKTRPLPASISRHFGIHSQSPCRLPATARWRRDDVVSASVFEIDTTWAPSPDAGPISTVISPSTKSLAWFEQRGI